MSRTRLWTKDEFILVMNLYTKIRYGQFNNRNSEVIKLAELIDKTPGAVAYKLVHLSSQDPYHQNRGIKGLANPGKNAIETYRAFQENWDDMLYESEVLLAKYKNKTISATARKLAAIIWNMVVKGVPYINPEGYLFLDQKRKLGLVKRIKKQIDKFGLTNEDIGFVNS